MRRSPPGIATCAAPRLACVKPVASVHPEPGSNSSLFKLFYYPRSGIRYCSPKSYFLTVSIRKINFPILVLLVELCKSLKELFCRFRFANVAAKIRTFILNLQIISELFSKSLFHHFVPAFSLECGCKSSVIKHNLQTFPVLFFKFFSRGGSRTLIIRRYPFSAHVAHHVASRVTTCT